MTAFTVHSIVRSAPACTRETRNEKFVQRRNPGNTVLHPFQQAREYVRALNATKLDRLFAKPLVGILEGHRDGIYALAIDPDNLRQVITGSADGDLRVWDLQSRRSTWVANNAHSSSFIRAVSLRPSSIYRPSDYEGDDAAGHFFSGGDDHFIKLWSPKSNASNDCLATYESSQVILGLDHHRKLDAFMSAGGEGILEWTSQRAQPIRKYSYNTNGQSESSYTSVRINPSQGDLFVASGTMDRSVVLGDRRTALPVSRQVLATKTNALAWNSMHPMMFACGGEDGKAYAFDLRNLKKPMHLFMDHVGPVMSVDFCPTGTRLLTGSYDKTIRLFDLDRSYLTVHSTDVYHTMRMQRIFCARFSADATYVLTGSDDGNVRVWKSKAAQPIGPLRGREQEALEYREQLQKKFQELPEIKRIQRHRHLPKEIKSRQRTERIQRTSQQAKSENRRKFNKQEDVSNARDQIVLQVD